MFKGRRTPDYGDSMAGDPGSRPQPPNQWSLRHDEPRLLGDSPVGIVPISWRPPPTDIDGLLADLRRLGYEGVQSGDTFPRGSELRSQLSYHQMRLAEVYAALPCGPDGPAEDALEQGRARLDLLREGEGEVLVVALDGTADRDRWAGRSDVDQAPGLSEQGWSRMAGLLAALADDTAATGETIAFHPHSGTYVETPSEIDRLLEETGDFDLGICLDTGHDLVGGGDPAKTVARIGARLRHLHLKDVDPRVLGEMRQNGGLARAIERRVFAPLGSGLLDLAGVLASLDEVGYEGWLMVEQDTAWEPPLEAAAISRRVLDWAQRHLASANRQRVSD